MFLFLFFFFFQAEDGIRDAQESRGLGDVYKRQEYGDWRSAMASGLETSSEAIAKAYRETQDYLPRIRQAMEQGTCLDSTDSPGLDPEVVSKTVGKVRDIYTSASKVALVATDRQSAFDRHLASVPFKGQVLSRVSQWWFAQTGDIVPNHVLAIPHSNITVGKRCEIFPIEFVVRGYITGSTDTAMWTHYDRGVRDYCGHQLPDGLVKNQRLETVLLTPTTKSAVHDECISAQAIVERGFMSQEDFEYCEQKALELFAHATQVAAGRGLILVDTKFEFGKVDGQIVIADEILTPDSSRYWISESYEQCMSDGKNPGYSRGSSSRSRLSDSNNKGNSKSHRNTITIVLD
eukprot:TRINITY_DN2992_c0_g1_i1.p1 TRINITY_DN2992_c0_g1~~TRINITY_DN2992_c0_g1_i1.p1  ORF type:complete len:348 (+),score=82.11 TRINITY_DN2992_c0_g1_i1:60-1103(+)